MELTRDNHAIIARMLLFIDVHRNVAGTHKGARRTGVRNRLGSVESTGARGAMSY